MIETLWQDVRHAVRALRRAPAFSATVIATMVLGIGGNTAVFSLLDAVMLRPLPVPHPEELFALREAGSRITYDPSPSAPAAQFSYPQFERFNSAVGNGLTLAAVSTIATVSARLSTSADSERVRAQLVTPGFFALANVDAQRGRLLPHSDLSHIDAEPVAVISDALWQRRFAASPDVVGRQIVINNAPLTIIGVAAPGFTGMWVESPVDIWLPLAMQHAVGYNQNYSSSDADSDQPFMPQEGITWLTILVRVPPRDAPSVRARLTAAYGAGLSIRAARLTFEPSRATMLARRLAFDSISRGMSRIRAQYASPLYMLMALVAIVLAIACLNIANVMLARGAARRYDTATRLSLGAPPWRLIRQPLLESLLLAIVGGGIGIVAGHFASRAIATMVINVTFPFATRVLAFSAVVTILSAMIFGLLPALFLVRHSSRPTAGGDSVGTTIRPMQPLVAVQVGMAFVLGVTAVLFATTLRHVTTIDPGFEREHLVAIWVRPALGHYSKDDWPALHARLLAIARSVPGVSSATLSVCGLANGCHNSSGVTFEGVELPGAERAHVEDNFVAAGYFQTVGMRVIRGREFDEHDGPSAPEVAIVNESTVQRYFNGADPIGRRIGYGSPRFRIVGVVSDARTADVTIAPVPMVYFPIAQTERAANSLDARVVGDAALVATAIRRAISTAEPRVPIERVTTIGDQLYRNTVRQRLIAYLSAGFGGVALLLACIGVYGVLSYWVVQRTREMAVRLAVGATGRDIIRLVLTRAGRLLAVGVFAGTVATVAFANGAMRAMLVGASASDPVVLGSVATALVMLGLVASVIPARRAASLDPMASLRAE
jgi:predicted permease